MENPKKTLRKIKRNNDKVSKIQLRKDRGLDEPIIVHPDIYSYLKINGLI